MRTPEVGDHVTENVVLIEKRGAGGMGHVWIAEHRALRTEVAVKLLWPTRELSPRELERFLREASAAARVKSPHVVTVFDSGVSDVVGPYLVMELLEGEDLEERLHRDDVLSPAETTGIFSQICHAIDQAHESGLVHRDLKPANIFLLRGPNQSVFAKVLDFGIARDVEDPLTMTENIVIGTPGYMSPEQACGGEITPASDLYSLGLVAFRTLTGTHAISRSSRDALGFSAYKLDLPRPSTRRPGLPESLDAWFKKACAFAREDRFASASDLADALAIALATAPEKIPAAQLAATEREGHAPRLPSSNATVPEHAAAGAPLRALQVTNQKSVRVPVLAAFALGLGLLGFFGARTLVHPAPISTSPTVLASPGAATVTAAPVRFPMLVDLHGENQKRGAAMLAAARAGALAVNRQGGIAGSNIEIVPLDDEGDTGNFLAQKVGEIARMAGTKIALGPTLSNQTFAAAPLFAKAGILEVSASASSTALVELAPTLLRLAPSDAGQAKALAALLKDERCVRVAIVAGSSPYGKAFSEQLSRHLPEARTVFVPPEAQRSYAAEVREVTELAPTCVALVVTPPVASRYILEAARGKLKPAYFAGDTLASQDFIELGRGDRSDKTLASAAEGVRGVRPVGASPDRPEYRYFEKLYREVAASDPLEPFLAMQFDAVVLAGIALREAGLALNAVALKETMLKATRGTAPFGPQQLDELLRAQRRGVAVDYEAASGDMTFEGDERVGVFENWKVERAQLVRYVR